MKLVLCAFNLESKISKEPVLLKKYYIKFILVVILHSIHTLFIIKYFNYKMSLNQIN